MKCLFYCILAIGLSSTSMKAQQQPHSFVADANHEYAAIFSHPDKPCSKKTTTADFGDCITKEVKFADTHLAAFLTAARGIVSGYSTDPNGTAGLGTQLEL